MIYFSLISRLKDGLPLVSTTDATLLECGNPDMQEGYKQLKVLSRKAYSFPDRCSYEFGKYSVRFITTQNLVFLVLCETSYPVVLAFCFLDDIKKDFLMQHDPQLVDVARRPYSCIGFDRTLQNTKHRFNNPRSLTSKMNFSELSQEIKLRPPYSLSGNDLIPENHKSIYSYRSPANSHRNYVALGLPGTLTICIIILCAFLNLTRGFTVMNEGHLDAFDSELYQYGCVFLTSCLLSLYQVYLIMVPSRRRKPLAAASLVIICFCQLYLWEFRNNIFIIAFHITAACIGTFIVFTRQIQEKLPQYTL